MFVFDKFVKWMAEVCQIKKVPSPLAGLNRCGKVFWVEERCCGVGLANLL